MNAKLQVVQGRPKGKTLLFPLGDFIFGRGAECHIRPNSDWVSRQHFLLRVSPDGVFIRDLGSRNGTLVNGMRVVEERRLQNHDQIQLGPLVFEVQLEALQPTSTPVIPDQEETGVLCADTAELPKMDDSQSDALASEPEPPDYSSSLPPAP